MNDQLLQQITDCAINPALKLLPDKMDSKEARVMMLAIGLQESRLTYRVQVSQLMPSMKGPARGLWQFERGGGCVGVLTNNATRDQAKKVCAALDVPADSGSVWAELEHHVRALVDHTRRDQLPDARQRSRRGRFATDTREPDLRLGVGDLLLGHFLDQAAGGNHLEEGLGPGDRVADLDGRGQGFGMADGAER